MGRKLSCRPMNHPLKANSESVAGAAQMRMWKYRVASSRTSGEQSTTRKASHTTAHCRAMSTTPDRTAMRSARIRMPPVASPRP